MLCVKKFSTFSFFHFQRRKYYKNVSRCNFIKNKRKLVREVNDFREFFKEGAVKKIIICTELRTGKHRISKFSHILSIEIYVQYLKKKEIFIESY